MKTAQQAQKLKDSQESHLADSERLMHFLQNSTEHISEFLVDVLIADQKDRKTAVGHLVRSFIKDKVLSKLGSDLKQYKEQGVIKQDFLENDINRMCFKDLLEYVDSESPDMVQFNAVKSILITSLEVGIEHKHEILARELMKISEKLSSAEIAILHANYKILHEDYATVIGRDLHNRDVKHWASALASLSEYSLPEIVLSHEQRLVDLHLISKRGEYSGDTAPHFVATEHFRLTPLGYILCEYSTRYQ